LKTFIVTKDGVSHIVLRITMPKTSILWRGRPLFPSHIFCIGKNYADHVKELGDRNEEALVVFMKPAASITNNLQAHEGGESLHYEAEISLLLEGGQAVGVGFGFDLTKRELQGSLKKRGLPWELCKAFRGSALFSEFVPLEVPMESLEVILEVEGEVVQHGRVPRMIHSPRSILQGLEAFQDLEDGDVVMTGTPAGVGPLQKGRRYLGRILGGGQELVKAEWLCN